MDTELLNGKDLTKYMWGCDGSGIKKTLMEWLENLRGVIVLTGGCDWNWRQLSSTHIRDGLRVTVWSLEASQHPNKRGGAVNLDQLKGPSIRQQQHIPAKSQRLNQMYIFKDAGQCSLTTAMTWRTGARGKISQLYQDGKAENLLLSDTILVKSKGRKDGLDGNICKLETDINWKRGVAT